MSEPPSVHDLAVKLAQLEERMNTKQAEYEGALERLRVDIANQKIWIMATVIAVGAFVIAAIGLFLG